jgi:tellurite resistance protein TehA-like permease
MKTKGWRTVAFSVAVILTGLAELTDAISIIAPEYVGILLLLIGIGTLILRYLTDTAIGEDATEQTTTNDSQ